METDNKKHSSAPISQLKSFYYLKFKKSISSIIHKKSIYLTFILNLYRELQFLTLTLDKNLIKFWKIEPSPSLTIARYLLNPGLFILERSNDFKQNFLYLNYFIIVVKLITILVSTFRMQTDYKRVSREDGNSKLFSYIMFVAYYFVSVPVFTLYTGIFSCARIEQPDGLVLKSGHYSQDEASCSEFGFFQFGAIFVLILVSSRVYLGMIADYDRRIITNSFACNLSHFNACVPVPHNIYSKELNIDHSTKVCENIYSKFSAYLPSCLAITLLILYIKNKNITLEQFLGEKGAEFDLRKIELLLHMTKHQDHFRKYEQKIISNLENCYLFEENKEDMVALHSDAIYNDHLMKKFAKTNVSYFRKQTTKSVSKTTNVATSNLLLQTNDPKEILRIKKEMLNKFFLKKYLKILKQPLTVQQKNDVKISFSYFLHDFMEMGKEAFYQVTELEKDFQDLSMENQIDLVRMKSIFMEDESKKQDNFKVKSKKSKILDLRGIKIKRVLTSLMEKTAIDYNIFWLNVVDDALNLKKVRSTLLNSYAMIQKIQYFWEKNQKLLKRDPSNLLLYGNFEKYVLNDHKNGEGRIAEGQLILKKMARMRNKLENFDISDNINLISSPVCVIERCDSDLLIKSCNTQFSFLFGYTREELIGGQINKIVDLPSLNFYLRRFRAIELGSKNYNFKEDQMKKKLLVFLNKNRFLRVLSANLKIIFGDKGEVFLALKIEMRKRARVLGHILTTTNGRILSHNETTSSLFGLKRLKLKKNKVIHLGDIADQFDEVNYYNFIDGGELEIFNKKTKKPLRVFIQVMKPSCCRKELIFCILDCKEMQSALLTKSIYDDIEDKPLYEIEESSIFIKPKIQDVNFYFTATKEGDIHGRYMTSDQFKNMEDFNRSIEKRKSNSYLLLKNAIDCVNIASMKSLTPINENYGEGIRTKRLFQGALRDMYEFVDDEESQLDADEQEVEKRTKTTVIDFKNKLLKDRKKVILTQRIMDKASDHKRRKIKKFLKKKPKIKKLKFLRMMNFVFLVWSVVSIELYLMSLSSILRNLGAYIKVNTYTPLRNENLKIIAERTMDIALFNSNIEANHPFRDLYIGNEYPLISLEQLNEATLRMDQYHNLILKNFEDLDSKDQILEYYNRDLVQVNFSEISKNFSLIDFFELANSASLKLKTLNLNEITFDNEEFRFIQANFLRRIALVSIDLLKFMAAEKRTTLSSFVTAETRIFYSFVLKSMIAFATYILVFKSLTKHKEKKLKFFYSFQQTYIEAMVKKTDGFTKLIQNGEIDFLGDNKNAIYEEDSGTRKGVRQKTMKEDQDIIDFFKKKKKVKKRLRSVCTFFNLFVMLILVVSSSILWIDKKHHEALAENLDNMAIQVLYLGRSLNRSHNFVILASSFLFSYKKGMSAAERLEDFENFLEVNDEIMGDAMEAMTDISQVDQEFFEEYKKIFTTPRCGDEMSKEDLELEGTFKVKCDRLFDGILKKDFSQSITVYYSKLRLLLDRIRYIADDNIQFFIDFDEPCQDFQDKEPQRRNMLCLLTSELMSEIKYFHSQYFHPSLKKIGLEVIRSYERMTEGVDSTILLIFLIYFFSEISLFFVILYQAKRSEDEINIYRRMMGYQLERALEENPEIKDYT